MLYMTDNTGNRRFQIHQRNDGSQYLGFQSQSGNWHLVVGEDNDGKPILYMKDTDGNVRFGAFQLDDGSQRVMIFDQNGNLVNVMDENG